MSKQDRQGSRTPAQLEQYRFRKTFAEAMGLASAAKKEAEEARKNVAALNVKYESEVTRLDDRIEMTVKKTETAQETANVAKGKAESAQQAADQAKADAEKAQNAADEADARASRAEADLVAAKQNLANVTERVDATEEEVEAAKAAVETAQAAADKANADAEAAQAAADAAKTSAVNAQSAAAEANGKAETAQRTAGSARSAADEAKKKAEEAEAEVISKFTTITQRADGVDLAVAELRKEVGGKADQAQVTEITEHFRFAEDGLTISNSGTGMGINVSEKQVAFAGGKDPTTVITPNAMETTNMTVGVRLDLGAFSLLPRSSGNLSLRYTGG